MELQPHPCFLGHRKHALDEVLVVGPHLVFGVDPAAGGRLVRGILLLEQTRAAAARAGGTGAGPWSDGVPGVSGRIDPGPAQVAQEVLEQGDGLVAAGEPQGDLRGVVLIGEHDFEQLQPGRLDLALDAGKVFVAALGRRYAHLDVLDPHGLQVVQVVSAEHSRPLVAEPELHARVRPWIALGPGPRRTGRHARARQHRLTELPA